MAIPRNGDETPEYTAIQVSRIDLTNLFALDTRRAATGLFKKLLLPDNNENAPFVDFVLRHIERDAINFYKFLGFLCSYGNEAKNEVEVIQRTYYGKLLSFRLLLTCSLRMDVTCIGTLEKYTASRSVEPPRAKGNVLFLIFGICAWSTTDS